MNPATQHKRTYSVSEVADILGYSTNSIYSFLESKKIRAVRMGKGRFKIPASEVERLLSISKPQEQKNPQMLSSTNSAVSPSLDRSSFPPGWVTAMRDVEDEPFNIFPWFFGLSMIVAGVSMFIFSTSMQTIVLLGFSWVSWILRIIFLFSGITCLWGELFGRRNKTIMGSAYAVAGAASFVLAGLYAFIGQPVGVLVFASFGFSIILSALVSGSRAFMFHLGSLLVGFPVLALVFPNTTGVHSLIPNFLDMGILTSAIVWICITLLASISYFIGKKVSPLYGIIGIGMIFALLAVFSIAFAQHMSWFLSFFTMVTAASLVISVVWDPESLIRRADKAVFSMTFLLVGSVFILAIGIVHIVGSSMIRSMSDVLTDRVIYGKVIVTASIDVAKAASEGVAQNTVFGDAVSGKKTDIIMAYGKGLLEGNRTVAETHIVHKDGSLLFSYPLEDNLQEEFDSVNSLISEALQSGKTVMETMSFTERGVTGPQSWIAVPIYNSERELVGGIAVSLDLGYLSDSLQQVTRSERGEYMEIIDRSGMVIIHPDHGDAGNSDYHKRVTASGGAGKRGIETTFDERGEMVLMSFDSIGRMEWGISAVTPIDANMELMPVAALVVSLVVISTLITVGMATMVRSMRRKVSIGGP